MIYPTKFQSISTSKGELMKKILLSAIASAMVALQSFAAEQSASKVIKCEGEYAGHLQGTDARGNDIWWSFTTMIVRTDLAGRVLASCKAPGHQGDLCVKGDTLYVAVNRGKFNTEDKGSSFVYSYDANTLEQKKIWNLDMPHGAGGITWKDDRFYVVGGLPPTHRCNYVYEYDTDFKLVKRHILNTGYTVMGIQTATYLDGEFLFGIYGGKGNPSGILRCSPDFSSVKRYNGPGAIGFAKIDSAIYTAATSVAKAGKRKWTGVLKLSEKLLDDSNLFTNTWYEKGVFTDPPIRAAKIEIGNAKGGVNISFDKKWRARMKGLVKKGYNAVFIDLADGFEYSGHKELSATGAWTRDQLAKAIDVARKVGIEPIPYMDFTAPRNAWLGEKNLPNASDKSLELCKELVADIVKAYDRSRFFRIETNGLSKNIVDELNSAIYSRGYGSCPWSLSGKCE